MVSAGPRHGPVTGAGESPGSFNPENPMPTVAAPSASTVSSLSFHPAQPAAPRHVKLAPLLAALAVSFGFGSASAASFTISSNSTAAQTLGSGTGQTGTVNVGKSLTVSGATVAVTVSGSNATLNNQGTIEQTGTGRVVRDNTGVSNLTVTNGSASNAAALMRSADADVIQMNKSPASVTLNNYGSMISLNASAGGSQAVDFAAIASGANTVNNYAGGLLKATEADAVRPGVNGVVNNWGTILSVTGTGSSSDGIDFQNNSGGSIVNYGTGLIQGGRHGITGGALNATVSFTTAIDNRLGGTIRGDNGSGINLDGFNGLQLVTVTNAGTIVGNGVTGDGDGIDVDGLVAISNTGTIRSVNSFSALAGSPAYSEGITVGGGTVVNSGTIEGLVAAGNANAYGRGITLSGNDVLTGPLAGTREGLYGNATVTNQAGGLIRGQNDSAIVAEGAASGYTVTIVNMAGGTVRGGSASAAAIRGGADKTAVTNGGLIDGSSSGKAIALGGAQNTVAIVGGAASVLGSIDGGSGGGNTLTLAPGAGNAFGYAGAISNFATVEVQSGTVTLSGLSSYSGATVLSGGTLALDGANRLAAGSALHLEGGTLQLKNAGGANGQSFSSLTLGADSTIDLGGSSLSFSGLGTVASGKTLSLLDYVAAASPAYAIRFLGNYSADASFLALLAHTSIDGKKARYRFDGVYTDVTAVPEPGSLALLLVGLVSVGLTVRRRGGARAH